MSENVETIDFKETKETKNQNANSCDSPSSGI